MTVTIKDLGEGWFDALLQEVHQTFLSWLQERYVRVVQKEFGEGIDLASEHQPRLITYENNLNKYAEGRKVRKLLIDPNDTLDVPTIAVQASLAHDEADLRLMEARYLVGKLVNQLTTDIVYREWRSGLDETPGVVCYTTGGLMGKEWIEDNNWQHHMQMRMHLARFSMVPMWHETEPR